MSDVRLQLVKPAGRLLALAAMTVSLAGCQGIAGTPQYSQVRVIDASPDAPGLDVYEGTAAIAYNLGFGTVTSYIPITPGTLTISVDKASTQQQLGSVKAAYTVGNEFTVIAGNVAANLQMTVLKDQATPAPSGQVAFRFLDQTTRVGAVDIYLLPTGGTLAGTTPIASNIAFGANTGYIDAPSGTYAIVAVPTGTVPTGTTSPTYTGSQVMYSGGAVRTIILIDPQFVSTPGLQVITASDYDSPSATS